MKMMSVSQSIRDELKRCRAEPARMMPLNSLENLNVSQVAAIEEWGRRIDARDHADVLITSRIMLFNEYSAGYYKLEIQRHFDVVLGIEALFDDTEGLELDFGHFVVPFIGSKAPVVIPIIALQFSRVKVQLKPSMDDLRPMGSMSFKVIGCMLKDEFRRQLCFDKLYCEQDFASENLATWHNMPSLQHDEGYNGTRFPSPSKFFDDDPSIDWFDPKQRCWILLRSYGPHLRNLGRSFAAEAKCDREIRIKSVEVARRLRRLKDWLASTS
jgi:hypothetical protein